MRHINILTYCLTAAVLALTLKDTQADPRKLLFGELPRLPGGDEIHGDQLEIGNSNGGNSAVYGILVPPGHKFGFPTALSDFAVMSNPGDQAFAHYSAVYGTVPGVWTSEFSSFNTSGDAPSYYPWSRGFGTKENVAIPVTCSMQGPYLSAACIEIAYNPTRKTGGQFGVAVQAGSVKQAAIIVDATADRGARSDLVLRHRASADGATIELETIGDGGSAVIRHRDRAGKTTFELNQDGTFTGPLSTKQYLHEPLQNPLGRNCAPGDILANENAIYICTRPNHWRHATLSD